MIREDGGSQHLLRDLVMKLGETPISIYRCVNLIQNSDSHWNAQKILLLLGSIGACQIGWIAYKEDIISKVAERLMEMPQLFATKEEHKADTASMEADEGGGAEDQEEGESAEVGNGLPMKIRASQVGWILYTAVIKFKIIEWFRKTNRVPAGDEEQVGPAGVSMENYGGGESGQQVANEDVQVVVASSA